MNKEELIWQVRALRDELNALHPWFLSTSIKTLKYETEDTLKLMIKIYNRMKDGYNEN